VGTFGVAILTRAERLRYIRDFYQFQLIRPIRSYIFKNFALDYRRSWNGEFDILPALDRLSARVRHEQRVPYLKLNLGSDVVFGYIPLACLGTPAYALIAGYWVSFSITQYVIIGASCVYSLMILLALLDLYHLHRKGVFGDAYPLSAKPRNRTKKAGANVATDEINMIPTDD
jgi:hypothetical protein